MNRQELISQVKEHYQKLASGESKENTITSTADLTPEAYYENLLGMVINEISAGTFDSFRSGDEIVNAVANDKDKWLSNWNHGNLS